MSTLTSEELRAAVIDELLAVAPDVDAATLDAATPFRAQFDFDSMDQLNFVIGLHRRFGVDIPERDYAALTSLDACVGYLLRALGATSP